MTEIRCHLCKGESAVPLGASWMDCPACGGTGVLDDMVKRSELNTFKPIPPQMTEERAREILGDFVCDSNGLYPPRPEFTMIDWAPSEKLIFLEGNFTPQELEAIAWWVRNKGGKV